MSTDPRYPPQLCLAQAEHYDLDPEEVLVGAGWPVQATTVVIQRQDGPSQQQRQDIRHAIAASTSLMHWVTSQKRLLVEYTAWLNEGCEHQDDHTSPEIVRRSLHDAHDLLAPGCDEPIEIA